MKGISVFVIAALGIIIIAGSIAAYQLSQTPPDNGGSNGMSGNGPQNQPDPEPQPEPEPEPQPEPQTYNVEIVNFVYTPTDLTVNVGDTVVWTNTDSVGHTITSDAGSELDSPLLGKGEQYSHTFTEAGTFLYHCTPHPWMTGTVTVEE